KVRSFRPFPVDVIRKVVGDAAVIVTLDKNISLGLNEGALCTEVKSCLYNTDIRTPVIGFMLGHGGRDIPRRNIRMIIDKAKQVIRSSVTVESEFADLRGELV
ncbi:MAG: pyruvate ferredoxin oxidoreductase, partial [ANME-2 cluster archaeon]|nr:pyruvate ferredoxin oxidoreductase [ANME-2 cluster archaeon]